MDNKGLAGIGHNQGPPMGGLTSLPVAEKAIGGAILKGAKAGLKSLSSMFESVGSSLKKAGLEKDERKEAAKSIQNEIDKVSKANNRKFRPKVLRMDSRPNQKNNYSDVVIAAVDDENGKVAAILNGRFFTEIDTREVFENASGTSQRKNKNFGKEINKLTVEEFFPVQNPYNDDIREILTSFNVPIYAKGEGVISPGDLAKLNSSRDAALENIEANLNKKLNEIELDNDGKIKAEASKRGVDSKDYIDELKGKAYEEARQAEKKVGMGHRADKIEMGTKGTLGFTKSLLAGLPITDSQAGRISGSKPSGEGLDIRGAYIRDTAAPMESLPNIDVSLDMLEEMGDKGLKSLTPPQLKTITANIVPDMLNKDLIAYRKKIAGMKQKEDPKIVEKLTRSNLPSNVKRIEELDKRMDNITYKKASVKKDPYAARLIKEQDKILTKGESIYPTIGELYSDETLIEKLQYTLLNRLGGKLSSKKGLGALIKRSDDEMIVGSRSSTEEPQVMITAEGERLVPRKDFINPRIQKERISAPPSYEEMLEMRQAERRDLFEEARLGRISPDQLDRGMDQLDRDIRDISRTRQDDDDLGGIVEIPNQRGNVLDDDSLGDNPEPPEILYEMIRVDQGLPGNGFNDLQELEQAFSQGDMSVDVFLREIDAFEESGLVPEDEIREYSNMLSQMLDDTE